MKILIFNCGSSSIKYSVFDKKDFRLLAHGIAEEIGAEKSNFKHSVKHQGSSDIVYKEECQLKNYEQTLKFIICILTSTHECPSKMKDLPPAAIKNIEEISIIGHRVVHGGEEFMKPTILTDEVMTKLEKLNELAPLHNPAAIEGIKEVSKLFSVPHVLVFDTAFHHTIPAPAFMYGLPFKFYESKKLRKYGFHGTSHQYVSKLAAKSLSRNLGDLKLISLHLGNGCSACAIKGGKSVDNSMGFTPLSGLLMGTRSGDIDPSVLFQMAEENFSELENLLNKKSGMLGICGYSDMREVLEKSKKKDEEGKRASLAIEMFCYSAKKYIGSYFAILGGIDTIIFTAGIGEHSSEIRERILEGLECLGIEIHKELNKRTTNPQEPVQINGSGSKVKILVIPTDEEREIAQQAEELINQKQQ